VHEKKKLVAFDVEGVLIPKGDFLLKIFIKHKPMKLPKLLATGLFYYLGIIPMKQALENIYSELEGLEEETLISTIKNIDIKPGAEELLKNLKKRGHKVALITSGIPQKSVDSLAEKLPFDFGVGLETCTDKGVLNGKITGTVVEEDGKAHALMEIINEHRLQDYTIISVADDRNNLSLFKESDLKIGYHPDFMLGLYSDNILNNDLMDIIPIIEGMETSSQGLTRNNLLRKTVHLSALLIPLFLTRYLSNPTIATLLTIMAIIYLISEAGRKIGYQGLPLIQWFTLLNTSTEEASEFVDDPLYFAIGIALSLLLFPKNIAYAAITVLSLGDPAAAIAGKLFGNNKIPHTRNKTIEGSLAFTISAYLGCLIFIKPAMALISAITGAIAEALPTPINDNLLIPIATGLILMII
jgi:phosphoserine phosphatase